MIEKNIEDVHVGDILAKDIVYQDILLIKKHTALTKRLIHQLKSRKIRKVHIKMNKELDTEQTIEHQETDPTKNTLVDKQTNDEIKILQSTDLGKRVQSKHAVTNKKQDIYTIFLHTLQKVGEEQRYGKLLNNRADLSLLFNQYRQLHEHEMISQLINQLKAWDYNTYIHSFDVFIIGTIIAKSYQLNDLKNIAAGYYLHDIGKLAIDQLLIKSNKKFTLKQYEKMKEHTIKGEAILKIAKMGHLTSYARNHHERLDGSGYPDQLVKHQLSLELRILQVVDVYSALTLPRAYKQARPAHEALKILRNDSKAFDKAIVEKLMYLLGIFPEGCSVKLSNGKEAIITDVSPQIPQFPSLKLLKTGQMLNLPNDFSITIKEITAFHSITFNSKYENLFNRLMEGNYDQAIQLYKDCCDGLKIEETYTRILLPLYFRLVSSKKNHSIKQGTHILNQLFDSQKSETPKINLERKILLIVPEEKKESFPIRVLRQLFYLENTDTIILKYARIIKGWHIFYKYGIRDACLIIRENESEYEFIKNNRHVYVATYHWNAFLVFLKQFTHIEGRQLNIYQHMFKDKT